MKQIHSNLSNSCKEKGISESVLVSNIIFKIMCLTRIDRLRLEQFLSCWSVERSEIIIFNANSSQFSDQQGHLFHMIMQALLVIFLPVFIKIIFKFLFGCPDIVATTLAVKANLFSVYSRDITTACLFNWHRFQLLNAKTFERKGWKKGDFSELRGRLPIA